ncbi:MAG: hypothetical protein OCU22_04755 [Canidatus Methanoxibalbensis ujae]|nr:hypothetical protein [Candidatus Methanoxibalbensis ujae]
MGPAGNGKINRAKIVGQLLRRRIICQGGFWTVNVRIYKKEHHSEQARESLTSVSCIEADSMRGWYGRMI